MMKMYKDSNNVSLEITVQGCVLVLGGMWGWGDVTFVYLFLEGLTGNFLLVDFIKMSVVAFNT